MKEREALAVQVIDTWTELAKAQPGELVVALGNFDGVHLGHRQLITAAVAKARQLNKQTAVVTFNPHPLQVLAPEKFPKLLTTLNQRIRIFAQLGVDLVVLLPFTPELARLTPDSFVQDILLDQLNAVHLFVGFNFSFGHGGTAGPSQLKEMGQKLSFGVTVVERKAIDGVTVSSTEIRQAIERGDMEEAQKYLGRYPSIEGIVVSGDRVGRTIGFPTANVEPPEDLLIPARGVYAAWFSVKGQLWPSMVNIGFKPTFKPWNKPTVEAHIFNFSQDIYDQRVEIYFCRRLRNEEKFSSVGELLTQLERDQRTALAALKNRHNPTALV